MMLKPARAFAALSWIVLAACGSGGGGKCVAGETKSCACTNGQNGAQTCGSDGTFGSCVCSGNVGGGAGGGTAAGGGAGGGSGGGTAAGGGGGGDPVGGGAGGGSAAGGGAGGGSAAGGGAGGGSAAGGGAGGGSGGGSAAGGGAGGGSAVGGGAGGGSAAGGGAGGGGGSGGFTCVLPSMIDWGVVGKDNPTPKSIVLNNPTNADITATIGPVTSLLGDAAAFAQTGALGVVTIPANTSATATITFTPTAVKAYMASVEIRVAATCPLQTIQLTGQGVNNALAWGPVPVDFGFTPPNVEVFRDITFTNISGYPISLSGLNPIGSDFRVSGNTALTVPAFGNAKTQLGFKPTVIGARTGSLQFTTNLPGQPSGAAALKGAGGGPVIEVTPSPTLAFGTVAYFAGANPPSFTTRTLTIRNAGVAPNPPDPAANLTLGNPAFSVVALNAQTSLSEFAVTLNPTFPMVGLVAGQTSDLQVKFTPASVGLKSIEITIHSNDLTTPNKKITVTANAQVLPACSFTSTPATVAFGAVAGPREFPVTLTNTGTGPCQFSNITTQAGSNAAFSVVGGPIGQIDVASGQSTTVRVRVAPSMATTTAVNITGTLVFNVSSPTTPQATVPLTATVVQTCLTFSPGVFDYGTVQKTCNSPTVTFQVFNTCATAATFNSNAMTLAAGEPAGGPNCPGVSACPEFIPVNTTSIAANATLAPAATTNFSLKYKPINDGADVGAFSIGVTQNGQMITYVLGLAGAGNANGLNTDTTNVGTTKTDVLLIVDDSCSMFDKQQKLANNFGAFFSAAGAVDWQLGVTTTDNPLKGGRLISFGGPLPDGGTIAQPVPALINAQTPDLTRVFQSKVNVGTNGDAVEMSLLPAVSALTPPIVNAENAGLVRNDASMAIVSISDADDQSPQTVSYYVSQLLALKPPGKLTWSAMAPLLPAAPANCSYDMPGNRTPQAIAAIGGLGKEVCEIDWGPPLQQLSAVIFGGRNDVYFLKAVADLTGGKTITVKVDGVTVPATSGGQTIWSYSAVDNAVTFTPFYIPQPGQTVAITYFSVCL